MALINCPECNKQISDRAAACPVCACPIAAQPTAAATAVPGPKVQTIEATGKKWKGIQLISTIVLGFSLIALFATMGETDGTDGLWALLAMVSLFALAYARFGAWWHHK